MKSAKHSQKMDILNGSIWNKIPMYALPVAATGILEQLFNASDVASEILPVQTGQLPLPLSGLTVL